MFVVILPLYNLEKTNKLRDPCTILTEWRETVRMDRRDFIRHQEFVGTMPVFIVFSRVIYAYIIYLKQSTNGIIKYVQFIECLISQ